MALRNETTIEGSTHPEYDVGWRHNMRQIFGRRRWTWLLPCYCGGPDGDGLHWPPAAAPICALSAATAPVSAPRSRRDRDPPRA